MSSNKKEYSFPKFTMQQIVKTLSETPMAIQDIEILKNPTVEAAWQIFVRFLEEFSCTPDEFKYKFSQEINNLKPSSTNLNNNANHNPNSMMIEPENDNFAAPSTGSIKLVPSFVEQHSDIFEDGFIQLSMFLRLQKIMSSIGVSDFSFLDVIEPQPERLCIHISALINYTAFREKKVSLYSQSVAQIEELAETLEKEEEKKWSTEQTLASLQNKIEDEAFEHAKTEEENIAMEEAKNVLIRKIELLNEEIKKNSEILRDFTRICDSLTAEIDKQEQEIQNLKPYLVSDIESLKNSVEITKNSLENLKRANLEKETEMQSLVSQKQVFEGILERMKEWNNPNANGLIQKWIMKQVQKKDLESKIKNLKTTITDLNSKEQQNMQQKSYLERTIENLKVKNEKQQRNLVQNKEIAKQTIESSKRELIIVKKEQMILEQQNEKDLDRIRELKEKLENAKNEHDFRMKKKKEKFLAMRGALFSYCDKLKMKLI